MGIHGKMYGAFSFIEDNGMCVNFASKPLYQTFD